MAEWSKGSSPSCGRNICQFIGIEESKTLMLVYREKMKNKLALILGFVTGCYNSVSYK